MTNVYDVLEICLEEIEKGADVESLLIRYPEFAQELRPILQAASAAKGLSPSDPSEEILRRNRAKVLQHAAEMREAQVKRAPRLNWFAPLRRLAFTLAILVLAFFSGTNLVGAASTSLPGDELYPVKRSWERLQVIFLLDSEARKALEVDHENERIEELLELIAGNRSAGVTFSGLVTRQNGSEWLVAGIRVQISPEAELPDGSVPLLSAVRVRGSTQADGSVLAESIEILSAEDSLPEIEDESHEDDDLQNENESMAEVAAGTPIPAASQTPDDDQVEFSGVLNVGDGDFWTINGVASDVSNAEVVGTPAVGASVTVEGYFNPDGVFIVTKITFEENDSNSGSGSNSNTNSNDNANDNDASNDNTNGNDNDNDDNSGSGGGGDD